MSAEGAWPWSELGLAGRPDDPKEVRRAYARRLKRIDQIKDVQAFERLRIAYETARQWAGDTQAGHRRSIVAEMQAAPPPDLAPVRNLVPQDAGTPPVSARPQGSPACLAPEPEVVQADTQQPGSSPAALCDPQTLLAKAADLSQANSIDIAGWSDVVAAPALIDPQLSRMVQDQLLSALMRDEARLKNGNQETQDFFAAIDARFGWVSDGVGFLRRFPQGRTVQNTMAHALPLVNDSTVYAANSKFRKRNAQGIAGGRPVPLWLWIITSVTWFLVFGWAG